MLTNFRWKESKNRFGLTPTGTIGTLKSLSADEDVTDHKQQPVTSTTRLSVLAQFNVDLQQSPNNASMSPEARTNNFGGSNDSVSTREPEILRVSATAEATIQQSTASLQTGNSANVSLTASGQTSVEAAGSRLSFHNVSYDVRLRSPCSCCYRCGKGKKILHDISGVFRPGMNAIMGPTGSGKTTLLDVLAGRTELSGLQGQILLDGQKRPKNFKCMTGYVVQDDIVMGTLTVRENLMFSANLRLPSDVSQSEKRRKVDRTIYELGLSACADSRIGTDFTRGVSGGERKRTNIGMELIISPAVLFLDEPTTGLDASTASAVMSLLHRLSRKGQTIIFSIHQPRYAIFKLFDRLTLLAAGRTIYHGPSSETIEFFKSIGYTCEEHNNPSDYFLDVIIGGGASQIQQHQPLNGYRQRITTEISCISETVDENGLVEVTTGEWRQTNGVRSNGHVNVDTTLRAVVVTSPLKQKISDFLADKFLRSTWAASLDLELRKILCDRSAKDESTSSEDATAIEVVRYATSPLCQLRRVAERTVLNLIRSPIESLIHTVTSIVFAVVLGGIFFQLNTEYPSGLQNRVGSLFFVILNEAFISLAGIEIFIRERKFLIHENASGFYRVSAFFLSKICCALIPMQLVPLCVFSGIVYFMIGFKPFASNFFIFLLALFMTSLSSSALVYVISATFSVFSVANLICTVIIAFMMIFGGLFVNITSLPDWISWLQYISIVRYSNNVLLINELSGLNFTSNGPNGTVVVVTTGDEFLKSQGIEYQTAWDLWQNIMALGIIAIGLSCIAYVQLRRIRKVK